MTNRKTKNELTSNQYFGAINRRFDNRARQLGKLGFKYLRNEQLGLAFFVRLANGRPLAASSWADIYPDARLASVSAEFVSRADNGDYAEKLGDILRRGFNGRPRCTR